RAVEAPFPADGASSLPHLMSRPSTPAYRHHRFTLQRRSTPMSLIRVVITTYGILHGPAPADGDALLIDLSSALRNPHQDPELRYRNGLDPAVRDHVLTTPGADRVVALGVDRIR